ncbi:MAG: glutamate synthase central domain-containing protein, partial [Thermoguttaceae bacterium]
YEHDACGIGLVATLTNEPRHEIVKMGIKVLKRLIHRGAAGSDPETGDGAGILTAIPDMFFRKNLGFELPEPRRTIHGTTSVMENRYAVAVLFGGLGHEELITEILAQHNIITLGWRDVPINIKAIGKSAQSNMPLIRQLFVSGEAFETAAGFERKLFVARRILEKKLTDTYFCSFSSKNVIYKGLFLATQIDDFYVDLQQCEYASPVAVVHQRYSTNTFPKWHLAHPYRFLAHNGEINTIRGNINQQNAREQLLASELFGDELKECFPLINPGQSDSASLDNMFELLVHSGRSMQHALLMLMPQAWGAKYHLGKDVRAFFEYHSMLMEPWDGPAAVVFCDGVNAGAILDRNGLRPARYTLTHDDTFVLASETGVIDFPSASVKQKGRLKPGEMIFCDIANHRIVYDAEIKNQLAREKPYRRWIAENKIEVDGLFDSITPPQPMQNIIEQQLLFNWSREDVDKIVKTMAQTGQEPVGAMGNDTALAIFSRQTPLLYNYFKQLFAQVTNPPIDPIREELVMSLTTYIGNKGNILTETPEHARLIKLKRPILTDEDVMRLSKVSQTGLDSVTIKLKWYDNLQDGIDQLVSTVMQHVENGKKLFILSDRDLPQLAYPIPALLATAAVNRALVDAGVRPSLGIIVQTGE